MLCILVLLGRAPQGARGLKSMGEWLAALTWRSRPARGAWVEIRLPDVKLGDWLCRAPQGARGLKLTVILSLCLAKQVAPRKGRVG